MSNKSSNNNFFQPVISVVGLAVSLITAVLPLFSKEVLTKLFINTDLARPTSFLAFMLGIAIIWQITEFQPYLQINLGKYKKRKNEFSEYWKSIGPNGVVWILIFSDIIVSFLFFYIGIKHEPVLYLGILQSFLYLIFFLCLIAIFAILFAQTKQRFSWLEDKENFPTTIFEVLEKNRLIKPYIEIYENRPMNLDELQNEGIAGIVLARKIRVKSSVQEEEIIEFIVSGDGKEIIKVLKKGK
ncbi:MAG TPA: hypothetical protein DCS28_00485 [Candidatus Moranbacteria bacterium]|nr:hypothetical protein [Candidatus Moranbacteria bacterium]HAT74507.1 hypothetical protein [Candidatus Moranbacteria bacterium]